MFFGKKRSMVLTALLLIMIVFLSGCKVTPESTVNGFFKAWKRLDFQKASKYVNGDEMEPVAKEDRDIYKALYSNLEYHIDEVSAEKDEAIVKVSLENIDILAISGEVFGEILGLSISQAFSGADLEEGYLDKLIIERLTAKDVPRKTTTVYLKLLRSKDGWLIEPDYEFAKVLVGDLAVVAEIIDAF